MADVIDTPLRLYAELTPQGQLAGHYQLEFQRRVETDGVEIVRPEIKVRDLTPEEGAAILNSGASEKAAEVQALNSQIQGYREQIADREARLGNAVNALRSVAHADSSWDNSPRSQVAAVLEAEAAP